MSPSPQLPAKQIVYEALIPQDDPGNYLLAIFQLDQKGTVYVNFQIGDDPTNLFDPDGWKWLDGIDIQQIVATHNADGRLEVFALGGDHAVYHNWQITTPGGPTPTVGSAWQGWANLGKPPGINFKQIEAKLSNDGRLIVFGLDTKGNSIHFRNQFVKNGNWDVWKTNDTNFQTSQVQSILGVNNPADGLIELFAVGQNNQIYHLFQKQTGDFVDWIGWDNAIGDPGPDAGLPLMSQVGGISIVQTFLGAFQLFVIARLPNDPNNFGIYSMLVTNPRSGAAEDAGWLGWSIVQDQENPPFVVQNLYTVGVGRGGDGHLEFFTLVGDLTYLYGKQVNVSSGDFPEWTWGTFQQIICDVGVANIIAGTNRKGDVVYIAFGTDQNWYAVNPQVSFGASFQAF